MESMEIEGLSDVGSLFGLGELKDDAMDAIVLGASAGASVIVGELLFTKVDMLKKQNVWVQSGIAAVLGLAGGIAAGRYVNKSVGAGISAGLIGWAIAKSVQKATSLSAYQMNGLGAAADEDLLLGLGYSNTDVQDYRPLPGQTAGVGNFNVDVQDEQPLPGGGYLSGLGSFLS